MLSSPLFSFQKFWLFLFGVVALLTCNQLFGVNAKPLSLTQPKDAQLGPPSYVPASIVDQLKFWAKFASAAYCDVENWNCGAACDETAGTRLIQSFSKPANKVYVAINDRARAIIVAYRGTYNVHSLIRGSMAWPVDFPSVPGAKVHAGWLATYMRNRYQVTSLVKSLVLQYPDYKVILTGHSLGGVLAIFQFLDLVGTPNLSPNNMMVYTYGQPRVGNKIFAEHVERQGYSIFRVVDQNDIIPHYPPRLLGYWHHSPEYWINSDDYNQVVLCPTAEDPACSSSAAPLSLLQHFKYFDSFFGLECF